MADFEVTIETDDSFNGGTLAEETADGGGLSLREALGLANADQTSMDTITFAQAGTFVGNGYQFTVSGNVTIDGDVDGDGRTDVTLDAGYVGGRVMQVTGGSVNLHALTLTGGYYTSGAGLLVSGATASVTLTNSIVTNNYAGGSGRFGDYEGGGIAVLNGLLDVENTLISDNRASGYDASGGGVYVGADGTLNLTNSTVSGNSASPYSGVAPFSTVGEGGGIAVSGGNVTLTHTTVTDNTVRDGVSYQFGDASNGYAPIYGTTSGEGGGIFADGAANLTLVNSIVIGNTGSVGANVAGTVDFSAGSLTDGDAALVLEAALADNGGPVETFALVNDPSNAAIDLGAAQAGLNTDANGNTRNADFAGVDNGGTADAGAVEVIEDPSLIVTTSDDVVDATDGVTSLREAIAFANDGDTITFDETVFTDTNFLSDGSTIYLQSTLSTDGDFTIDGDTDGDGDADVVISGDVEADDSASFTAGSNAAFITDVENNTAFGDNVQVLAIGPGDVTLNGLVITGGVATDTGGGISTSSATSLTITNSLIAGNSAQNGAGIGSAGNLTVIDSEVSHNTASQGAGGIYATRDDSPGAPETTLTITGSIVDNNAGTYVGGINSTADSAIITASSISNNYSAGAAGGIYSNSALTLIDTVVEGNTAGDGGGGGIASDGSLTLTSSLINNNTASNNGAGVYAFGEDNVFTNTTFTNNVASGYGGAIAVGSGGFTADHVTITGNQALGGNILDLAFGGSSAVHQGGSGQIELTNSLVVGNFEDAFGNQIQVSGDVSDVDVSNNIIDADAGANIFAQTSLVTLGNTTVQFGVLADNGGPVQTVALRATAANAALDNAAGDLATDARGRARSDFAGLGLGVADIGAFELINAAPVVAADSFSVAEGSTAVGTVTASDDVDSGITFSVSGGADAALFTVDASTGALAFASGPNFEAPADADADNTYEVVVSASDGTNAATQTFDVAVTDVAEAQTIATAAEGGTTNGSDEGDTIAGNTGNDVINAGLGNDIIVDPGGDDTIDAGGGDDSVGLLSGMNTVSGGDGADLIVGGFGNDVLMGDAGMDVIRGDVSTNLSGSDRITGGTGNDLLEGRGGLDTFVFATGDGDDTIGALDIDYVTPANTTVSGADFVSGIDVIELTGFALADSDAALAAVTDVGGVATFAAEGTTITFAGLTADDLAADDFILV